MTIFRTIVSFILSLVTKFLIATAPYNQNRIVLFFRRFALKQGLAMKNRYRTTVRNTISLIVRFMRLTNPYKQDLIVAWLRRFLLQQALVVMPVGGAVTKARLTKGTLLKRGSGSPTTYTTIAEVTAVGDFGQESALLDVTHLESTALEYILSLPDGSEMSVEANWIAEATDPTSVHETMITDQSVGSAVPFQIALPGSEGTFSFAALVRKWNLPLGPNVAQKIQFQLKITGAIDFS